MPQAQQKEIISAPIEQITKKVKEVTGSVSDQIEVVVEETDTKEPIRHLTHLLQQNLHQNPKDFLNIKE